MTEEYQAPLPSIDRTIAEIPEGKSRSKVIATIVDYNHPNIIINDGTHQLEVILPGFVHVNIDDVKVGNSGRFLIDVDENESGRIKRILAFHVMTKEQVNKYRQLVKIEQSQSK